MELWIQNCNFTHIWSYGKFGLWPLDLIFSEMLNTATTSLFDWQKFLLNGVPAQNCSFDHIWSCDDHTLWPLDLKFSEMIDPAPISLSDWQKFLPVKSKWIHGSKNEFLPIFGHLVTLIFEPKIFRSAEHCLNKSFPGIKVAVWYIWVEVWPKNLIFPIFGPLVTLTFDLWNPKSNQFVVIS